MKWAERLGQPPPKPNVSFKPLLREWAYARHYTNSEERDQQLSPWLHYYNFARPHGSLGYAPPTSRSPTNGTTY
jgi:transposase InsO family protein